MEAVGVALLHPGHARDALVDLAEALGAAPVVHHLLEACELEVEPEEAQVLVEDARERAQEGSLGVGALLPSAAHVVDVEEDGLGGHARSPPHGRHHHGVVDLPVEVVDGAPPVYLGVLEEVGEHLQEVGLAAPEVAGDPDADAVGGRVERPLVGLEEVGEVAAQLARDDVLVELLADCLVVGHLDDAVDVAVDVALEQVVDDHGLVPPYTRSNAR